MRSEVLFFIAPRDIGNAVGKSKERERKLSTPFYLLSSSNDRKRVDRKEDSGPCLIPLHFLENVCGTTSPWIPPGAARFHVAIEDSDNDKGPSPEMEIRIVPLGSQKDWAYHNCPSGDGSGHGKDMIEKPSKTVRGVENPEIPLAVCWG